MQQIFEKFNFLLNDDPYRQKTQPKYSSASSRICMPILAMVQLAIWEEIANTHERLSYFIYIDRYDNFLSVYLLCISEIPHVLRFWQYQAIYQSPFSVTPFPLIQCLLFIWDQTELAYSKCGLTMALYSNTKDSLSKYIKCLLMIHKMR